MDQVGLRELRQNASELVRRAEAGETLTITVSGRPAARLGPAFARQWVPRLEVRKIFDSPPDPHWPADRDLLDGSLVDPWTRA